MQPGRQRAPPEQLTGESFGKYALLRRIAVGGMAEVFLANLEGAAGFNKLVVIKQVLPHYANDPKFIEMFLDEGRLAARLSHPNIAQTFELGEQSGRFFIAMEYVAGESLWAMDKIARQKGRQFPLGAALSVMLQLLEALEFAHTLRDDRGAPLKIIHRDVSPTNVMVSFHGSVKLLDFGIARATNRTHQTKVGTVKGKAGFMAPEQCLGRDIDHRVDVFAAGAVLYSMVVGRHPYESFGATVREQCRDWVEARFPRPREVNPEVPAELEEIILKSMTRFPDQRYPSAAAMLLELERLAAARNLVPSPRELGEYVRSLFPERSRRLLETLDETTGMDVLQVSGSDILTSEVTDEPALESTSPECPVSEATRRERPSKRIEPVTPEPLAENALAPTRPRVEAPPPEDHAPEVRPRPSRWPRLVALGGAAAAVAVVAVTLMSGEEAAPPPPQPLALANPAPQAPAPEPAPDKEDERAAMPVAAPAAAPAPRGGAQEPRPRERRVHSATRRERTPPGVLKLEAYPWAKVSQGGRELGITPLKLTLPPGRHTLSLRSGASGAVRTVSVTIRSGEETAVFERFEGP